jgi:hypothetical protein
VQSDRAFDDPGKHTQSDPALSSPRVWPEHRGRAKPPTARH